jgi:hypothetical protein
MRFTKLVLSEFRQMGHDHGIVIVAATLAHLITNATFTACTELAARHLYFGPGANTKAFALICNAPLTASMAVLIATIALGKSPHHKVIDHHFFWNWLAVTILFGWSNSYAWFTEEQLAWRFAHVIVDYPPVTDWLDLQQAFDSIPAIINIMITTLTVLCVPVVILRRKALYHGHAAIAVGLVATAVIAFNLFDRVYQQVIDKLDIYRNWLSFPGFTPQGFSYDRIIIDLLALPVALPAWIITILIATAAVKAAIRERDTLTEPLPQ